MLHHALKHIYFFLCSRQDSLLLCLQDSTQDGRAGGGSNTSSHMVQEVVVVHPSGTQLNLQWSGYNPVRYFVPVQHKAEHDDTETDGG